MILLEGDTKGLLRRGLPEVTIVLDKGKRK